MEEPWGEAWGCEPGGPGSDHIRDGGELSTLEGGEREQRRAAASEPWLGGAGCVGHETQRRLSSSWHMTRSGRRGEAAIASRKARLAEGRAEARCAKRAMRACNAWTCFAGGSAAESCFA